MRGVDRRIEHFRALCIFDVCVCVHDCGMVSFTVVGARWACALEHHIMLIALLSRNGMAELCVTGQASNMAANLYYHREVASAGQGWAPVSGVMTCKNTCAYGFTMQWVMLGGPDA